MKRLATAPTKPNGGIQPSAKVNPSNWGQALLQNIITFDTSKLDVSSGIRIAIIAIIPLIIGLVTNQINLGLIGTLGAFNVSMPEVPRSSKLPQLHILGLACIANAAAMPEVPRSSKLPQLHILGLACIANAAALALGTLVGLTGHFAIFLFGFGFFIAAFLTIYSDIAIIGFVACVLFSIGIGLPGGGSILAAWDRLWTCFLGGLLGLAGVAIHGIITRRNSSKHEDKVPASTSDVLKESHQSYRERLKPVTANLFLKSQHLRFSFAFGIAGAIALAIAERLDLTREYWVLLTLAILLNRSDISTTLNFAVLRIIGTIVGALIGLAITAIVISTAQLLPYLFVMCVLYFSFRGLNYGLGTIFLTPFVLVLVNIPNPGHPLLAEARILDTFIAAG